jgi:predicted HNH restriction endonuclease
MHFMRVPDGGVAGAAPWAVAGRQISAVKTLVCAGCPNCHRRVHAGADGPSYNDTLMAMMLKIEPESAG